MLPAIVDGSVYQIEFSNGSNGHIDHGDPESDDNLLPDKVIRGKLSGAVGLIVDLQI